MGIQWFNIATIMIKSILISAVVAVAFADPEAKADPQYSLGSLGALGYTAGLYNAYNAYNGLNRGIYTTGLGAYNTLGAYNGLRTYNGLTGYNYYGGYRGKRSADAEAEPEAQCATYGCLGYNGYSNLGYSRYSPVGYAGYSTLGYNNLGYNSYANLGYARAGYAGLNGLRSYAPVSPYYSYQG